MPPLNLPISPDPIPTPPRRPLLGASIGAICLLLLGGSVFFSYKNTGPAENSAATASTSDFRAASEAFSKLPLEAKAVYVFDVRDGEVLYGKNSEMSLPLASITKVLTGLVAIGSLPGDTITTVSAGDLMTDGESGLTVGERWKLVDLVSFMLITSSNDAATTLRSTYEKETGGSFISAMNAEAKKLGLSQAIFTNETGLDVGDSASNTGSAKDVATLLTAALHTIPEALDVTRNDSFTFTSENGTVHKVVSTNELANDIPWSAGAKTGFTDSAGGNLAISFDPSIGRPVVIVVLGSSREGRFTDMQKLVNATLVSFQTLNSH